MLRCGAFRNGSWYSSSGHFSSREMILPVHYFRGGVNAGAHGTGQHGGGGGPYVMYRGAIRYGYTGASHGKYQTPCSRNPINTGSIAGVRGPAGPPARQTAGKTPTSRTVTATTLMSSFTKPLPPIDGNLILDDHSSASEHRQGDSGRELRVSAAIV